MNPIIAELNAKATPGQAVAAYSQARLPSILESTQPGQAGGRFSIFAADPLRVCTPYDTNPDPISDLRTALTRSANVTPPADLPFAGGWIGYLAYELGYRLDRVRTTRPIVCPIPHARFALYDHAAIYDHARGKWQAIAVDLAGKSRSDRITPAERIRQIEERLLSAADETRTPAPVQGTDLRSDCSVAEYVKRVERAQDYIRRGDIYQVNLTQRFVVHVPADPADVYFALRRHNPGNYSAFIRWGDTAILSSSPELFLELRDGRVLTRPIKGTRRRSGDPTFDRIQREALASSIKEQAELNMIIDLLRNDLGRVCDVGSVRVLDSGSIEEYATVFHRVASIEGRLSPDADVFDLLRATFPGGSITGAPKLRAMEVIHELEAVPRGVYCGAIGYLSACGRAAFNVAIRTMLCRSDTVHIHSGGAITTDSNAESEYDELLAKAGGMRRAVSLQEPVE